MDAQFKIEIEQACRDLAERILVNFKQFVTEKQKIIFPFAAVLSRSEDTINLFLIPVIKPLPISTLVSYIKDVIKTTSGVAFVVGYDGYSTIIVRNRAGEKKDSIIVTWGTAWNSPSSTAVRYQTGEDGPVTFESPIAETNSFSAFDTVFHDQLPAN